MATIAPTMNIRVGGDGPGRGADDLSVIRATWPNLNGANNVGSAISLAGHTDRVVQLTGCFNTATIVIEGSNDGSTYANLADANGNAVSFTAPGLRRVMDVPLYTRPRVVANGAVTDVAVSLLVRKGPALTR